MSKLFALFLVFALLQGRPLSVGSLVPGFAARPEIAAPAADAPAADAPAAEEEWVEEEPAAEAPAESYYGPVESEEDVYGTWQRETMYLEYYGCDADMIITFYPDGSYYEILLDHRTNDVLRDETGTWTWEGDEVVAQADGEASTVHYDISGAFLMNNNKYYTRIE